MNLKTIALGLVCALGLSAHAALNVKTAAGWQESAYMEFTGLDDAYAFYNAYVSADGGSNWTKLDAMLVRSYGTYGRVDAVGLKAGSNYKLKVVPVAKADSAEVGAAAAVSSALTVTNYDRSGFAHTGKYATTTGVGAYNNDGTLKSNAVVLYISAATAKTVKMTVNGATENPCVGLQSIISGYEKGKETRPLCVRFIGEVKELDSYGSKEEGLQVKGRQANSELNMTFEGIGNDAFIHGWGFLLRNAASVEIRNLGVATLIDDDISLDTDNDHIWIHNVDVYYGPNKGGDQKKGDGAIDIKSDSKHVTVAYCHFWDTGKSSMCGMKSETGPNYISYHHNWFDHSDSRHARVRTMSVHMYNNYFDGIAKYGVGACTGSSVFMEANYFRACPRPMLISLQGTDTKNGTDLKDAPTFSGEEGGIIKSFGNTFATAVTCPVYSSTNTVHFDRYEATTRDEKVPAEVKTLSGSHSYNNFDTDASVMYTYTPNKADDVPAVVKGDKGAGRIQHGDLQYTFTSADDSNSDITQALRDALDKYVPSLVDFIGEGGTATACPEGTKTGNTGDNPGGDNPGGDITSGGDFECYFTGKKPSSTFYTINGSYSDSKGKATVNGTEYTVCLKMESSTSVKFTLDAPNTIYLHFGDAEGSATIKIDGVKATATNAVITQDLAAGAHELTKDGTYNLFYINMLKDPATAIPFTTGAKAADKILRAGQLLIRRDGRLYNLQGIIVE